MLTHVDEKTQQPTMVDVTEKQTTARMARAQSRVQLPPEVRAYLKGRELTLKKGPVFQTAIIAGTQAAKKTSDLIPFCHPVPIESCKFNIDIDDHLLVTIDCEVKTTYKTGVEMEALTGAMTAALTIYDMCKALSHEIAIVETQLVAKTGGKRTVPDPSMLKLPIYGLVLTGGKSERMSRDKALIEYRGKPHALHIRDTLKPYCREVYLSARDRQWQGTPLEGIPTIPDSVLGVGPIAGILSAFKLHPQAQWIVVACDLIHFNSETVEKLLAKRSEHVEGDSLSIATAYKNSEKGFAEPLCTLYQPSAQAVFIDSIERGVTCPVKVLRQSTVEMLEQTGKVNLANINTPQELEEIN